MPCARRAQEFGSAKFRSTTREVWKPSHPTPSCSC